MANPFARFKYRDSTGSATDCAEAFDDGPIAAATVEPRSEAEADATKITACAAATAEPRGGASAFFGGGGGGVGGGGSPRSEAEAEATKITACAAAAAAAAACAACATAASSTRERKRLKKTDASLLGAGERLDGGGLGCETAPQVLIDRWNACAAGACDASARRFIVLVGVILSSQTVSGTACRAIAALRRAARLRPSRRCADEPASAEEAAGDLTPGWLAGMDPEEISEIISWISLSPSGVSPPLSCTLGFCFE